MTEDKSRQRRGARFRARRRAVDLLFEAEFRDVDPVGIVEERRELAKEPENQIDPVPDYTARIVAGVATTLDEIDTALASHLSSEWTLERLPAVDRAVLRVSAWELLHNHEDVPDKVAVDEGVGLAKEYGHDKAPSYVHAVLDSIARDRRIAERAAADAEARRIRDLTAAANASDREVDEGTPSDSTAEVVVDGLIAGIVENSAASAAPGDSGDTLTEAPIPEVVSIPAEVSAPEEVLPPVDEAASSEAGDAEPDTPRDQAEVEK